MTLQETIEKWGLKDCVECAKRITAIYAKTHKGRNSLEKECINKGYIVRRIGEIYPDAVDADKDKIGVFALSFNPVHRRGGFTYVR